MDRSDQIVLVKQTYSTTSDPLGQRTVTETLSTVFCSVGSVGMNEFYQAGQSGIAPEYKVRMNVNEYDGEKIAQYKNARYSIYRTYVGKGESIELYLEKKAGV